MFVTNSLSFLPQVDEIIMIENGEIIQAGTYEQLKNDNGVFADFISNYLSKAQVEDHLIGILKDEIDPERCFLFILF